MNTQKIVRHGEVLLVPTQLPQGAEKLVSEKAYIVGHSETGHNHILESTTIDKPIEVYMWKGDKYVVVSELAKLWHNKTGVDIHTTHTIVPGTYKVNIKKQYDYFAKAMVVVRD